MLDAAIAGSLLILSVLFIRTAFRKRLEPALLYSLWGLAAFRLCLGLLPAGLLPESRFSILSVLPSLRASLFGGMGAGNAAGRGMPGTPAENAPAGFGTGNAAGSDQTIWNAGAIPQTGAAGTNDTGSWQSLTQALRSISPEQLLTAAYLVGVVICLGWMLWVTWSYGRRAARGSRPIGTAAQIIEESLRFSAPDSRSAEQTRADQSSTAQNCAAQNRADQSSEEQRRIDRLIKRGRNVQVYLSDEIDSPCLIVRGGRPIIYITKEAAEQRPRLYFAVLHEMVHLSHGDLIWSALRSILVSLYWFSPFVWLAAVYSKRDCEVACDVGVIRVSGENKRLSYGCVLVELAAGERQRAGGLCVSIAMNAGKREMKERITMLAGKRKKNALLAAAALVIMVTASACAFTAGPVQASADAGAPGANGGALGNSGEAAVPVSEMSPADREALQAFAEKWGSAFAGRDGKTIYQLCGSEQLYLTMGVTGTNDEGETYYGIGLSSPWPWDDEENVVVLKDSNTIDIYYFFRTSFPSVSIERQTIKVETKNGAYLAADVLGEEVQISSCEEFQTVYGEKLPQFMEWADGYQQRVDEDLILSSNSLGRQLTDPLTALEVQMNIDAESLIKTNVRIHPIKGTAEVTLEWKDGRAVVRMAHPETDREIKAWVVEAVESIK